MNTSGTFVLTISLIITFGFIHFIYPKYILTNLLVHIILGVYYFLAMTNNDLIMGGHLMNCVMAFLFMTIISYNFKASEIFTGKLKYSLENSDIKVLNDMINRKIYMEKAGQIQASKGFNLVKGIDRLDIVGLEDNSGIIGFIKITLVENLNNESDKIGKCISNNFILPERSSRYPSCKTICSDMPNCNNISWNIKNNSCELFSGCTKYNRDDRYKSKLLTKQPKNILKIKENLWRGNYIISQNGRYVLVLEDSGLLKLYDSPNGSNKESMVIENIVGNIKEPGMELALHDNGILKFMKNTSREINWETENSPGLKTCLILLNRGLLVLYDISTDNIVWTHNNDWREDYTVEDLRKNIISETDKKMKYMYNLKTKKRVLNKSLVQHKGTITIHNLDGQKENGKIKIYTSRINNENYIHISDISIAGKYLIR